MRVLLVSLTDDPLDPPGAGRYGGAQLFMLDLCRYLVRQGYDVTFLTRKSRIDKPGFQQVGPLFRIHRLKVGPDGELPHHDLWAWKRDAISQVATLAKGIEPFNSVMSYNWISGLAAAEANVSRHVHHILSLGRVRKELGEAGNTADLDRDAGELEVFRRASRLVCVCNDELSALKRLYPEVDHSKAIVIPYPVELDAFTKRPLAPRVFLHWKAKRLKEGF